MKYSKTILNNTDTFSQNFAVLGETRYNSNDRGLPVYWFAQRSRVVSTTLVSAAMNAKTAIGSHLEDVL